jgi:hypothetical protein
MYLKLKISCAVCVLLTNFFLAQTNMPPGKYTSTNKKAINYLEEGSKGFEFKKDDVAEK